MKGTLPPRSVGTVVSPKIAADSQPTQIATPLSRWPEWCALSFYSALVAIAVPFHEPWADEAQAWQLARNLSLSDLFKTYIRYEGSPGLWHFLLWILNRAHVSYAGMHWFCGAMAFATASLLIFASPLPRALRLTLPFTYFLVFQYAVVARSYVLAPLLLFLIAYCWKKSPCTLALLLGLLANVAIHAAAISAGLALVYSIEQFRAGSLKSIPHRRKLLACGAILLAFYAFAIWTAKPPHDIAFKTSPGPFFISLVLRLIELSRPMGLAIPFWIAIAIWFASRRVLIYLLPALFCAGFCAAVYGNWWHVGLLYPLLIALLWLTWPQLTSETSRSKTWGIAAIAAMFGLQILWAGYALVFDHFHAFSPDPAAAAYLRPFVEHGDQIALTYADADSANAFDGTGILPYFDHNLYINQRYPFWWWSSRDTTEETFHQLLPTHPRLVVVEAVFKGKLDRIPLTSLKEPKYQAILQAGYEYTTSFCGTMPERLAPGLTNCHVIFQFPEGAIGATPTAPSTAAR